MIGGQMKICLATVHFYDALTFTPLALLYLKASLLQAGFMSDDVGVSQVPAGRGAGGCRPSDPRRRTGRRRFLLLLVEYRKTDGDCEEGQRSPARRPHRLRRAQVGHVARLTLAAHPHVDVIVKGEGRNNIP